MSVQQTLTMVSAQAPGPADPGGQGEDFGKSSPVGLLLLVLFAIAVAFLVRSMSKHLKKLPTTFDQAAAESAAPPRARNASAESEESARPAAESRDEEGTDEDADRTGDAEASKSETVSSATADTATSPNDTAKEESAERPS